VVLLAALAALTACGDADDDPTLATLTSALTGTRVPMFELYSAASTDHFYTISTQDRDVAARYGFTYLGTPFYVESAQAAGTSALRRFYKGPPQTDHFYTSDASEAQTVLGGGWASEGIEGYAYTTQAAGTTPLYRVSKWNGATGDLDHRFTTNFALVQSLQSSGWTYDGRKGFVWSGPEQAEGQNVPLTFTNYVNTGTVHVQNLSASPTTDHWYYNVAGCGSGGLIDETQADLNGSGGFELVRTTTCYGRYGAIDDFHQRVYQWDVVPQGTNRKVGHYLKDTDASRAGKEILFFDRAKYANQAVFANARLSSVKLAPTTAAVAIQSTAVLDTYDYPAKKIAIDDFDTSPGQDIALVGGRKVLFYRDGPSGPVLARQFDASAGSSWWSAGDTNGQGGAEIIQLDASGRGLRIFDASNGTMRWYDVSTWSAVIKWGNVDGYPGAEICIKSGSAGWMMITDRIQYNWWNDAACAAMPVTYADPLE
jgi:hypothetical protein